MTGAVLLFSIAAALGCFSIAVCTCLVVLKRGRDLFHLGLVASFGAATFWLGMATVFFIFEQSGWHVENALAFSRVCSGLCLDVAAWRLARVTPFMLRMETRGQLAAAVAAKSAAMDALIQRLGHLPTDPKLTTIVNELRTLAKKAAPDG